MTNSVRRGLIRTYTICLGLSVQKSRVSTLQYPDFFVLYFSFLMQKRLNEKHSMRTMAEVFG